MRIEFVDRELSVELCLPGIVIPTTFGHFCNLVVKRKVTSAYLWFCFCRAR